MFLIEHTINLSLFFFDMAASAPQAWLENLRSKIHDLRQDIDETYQWLPHSEGSGKSQFLEASKKLRGRLDAFFHLYGSGSTPRLLQELSQAVNGWLQNKDAAQFVRKVYKLYDQLDQLAEFDEYPSFEEIFQSYKDDGRLQELVSELIELIKKVVEEGSDILSATLTKELEAILAELQRQRKKSVIDLHPWVEFSLQSLAAVADAVKGTPIFTIATTAALTAFKTNRRIQEIVQEVRVKLTGRPQFTRLRNRARNSQLLSEAVSEEDVRLMLQLPSPGDGPLSP